MCVSWKPTAEWEGDFTLYRWGQISHYTGGDRLHTIQVGTDFTLYRWGQTSHYTGGDSLHTIQVGTDFTLYRWGQTSYYTGGDRLHTIQVGTDRVGCGFPTIQVGRPMAAMATARFNAVYEQMNSYIYRSSSAKWHIVSIVVNKPGEVY